MTHGTLHAYQCLRCRCAKCKAAATEAKREQRVRHGRTPAEVVAGRAQNAAMARLRDLHRAEYERLYREERARLMKPAGGAS